MKTQTKAAVMPANQQEETPQLPSVTGGQNNAPVQITRLGIAMATHLRSTEFNGVEVTDPAAMEEQVRMFARNAMLRAFNITEINKTPVNSGIITFNGVKTGLKLPKAKENSDGSWAETLADYYTRVKPELEKWLKKAMPNAAVTAEMIAGI